MLMMLGGDAAAEVTRYLKMENDACIASGENPSGVSANPVKLKVAGRDLPTLTLIDLPGSDLACSRSFVACRVKNAQ